MNNTSSTDIVEWNQLWHAVRENPEDFQSWEQLIRVAELTKGTTTLRNESQVETVYDSFLTKFPLCFVYWKKYADWKMDIYGEAEAEKVYERGVSAIRNSIDLWNHYCDFAQNQPGKDVRELFERAAKDVGLDFFSHPFWDKYLEYEEIHGTSSLSVLHLLDRIVVIPMHQYARYYEKWRQLRSTLLLEDALGPDVLEIQMETIKKEKCDISEDDMKKALRVRMEDDEQSVYNKTQEETNKRWVFEAEIKRTYFHVKPLDKPQLLNWKKYLDFEESAGNSQRIKALYERCLVSCAEYEDFWLCYGHWLISHEFLEEAKIAYERAVYTFLASDKFKIKIALACLLEEEDNIEEARKIYSTTLEKYPNQTETILNYIYFEGRQNSQQFEPLIKKYIDSATLDNSSKSYFIVQLARHYQQNGQSDKARDIYLSVTQQYPESKYAWLNYINFEQNYFDLKAKEEHIQLAFDKARNCKSLEPDFRADVLHRYKKYILERGLSVRLLNRVSPTLSQLSGESGIKRGATEENRYIPYPKQARYDSTPTSSANITVLASVPIPNDISSTKTDPASYYSGAHTYGYPYQAQGSYGADYYGHSAANWQG
ncbi:hypothetical protein J3Q64DRAFT_1773928 [Phycomyces blakesleeanus]|uniref:Suppressor of forked domain-containing protein n=2 Tax=Phycomyces blakesleeanus TaxID=4837 RepID=A0A167Q3B2_PHYB8|nr:hypothetical protein PHYBLDRAFT_131015 [Phycomyces blakesleeanus NRRL 1555(-)]OAD78997.1 hypothetical protein PHYBLDRAFT_131015 [Phycomyces blakesleeanus NRRL 1555(-)]|eukprot:XP_018297037.1 hypothetical protein PHYBLDRAFT_131015 [Phycomyces blakesleeanus NRRL 1555(-)]